MTAVAVSTAATQRWASTVPARRRGTVICNNNNSKGNGRLIIDGNVQNATAAHKNSRDVLILRLPTPSQRGRGRSILAGTRTMMNTVSNSGYWIGRGGKADPMVQFGFVSVACKDYGASSKPSLFDSSGTNLRRFYGQN